MKIVVDENISYGVVDRLRLKGYAVISISEWPNRGVSDKEVYNLILSEQAVLITRDYHFTNPIRFPAEKTEGILYIRYGNLKSDEEVNIVENFLNAYNSQAVHGKLVTLYRDSITIR